MRTVADIRANLKPEQRTQVEKAEKIGWTIRSTNLVNSVIMVRPKSKTRLVVHINGYFDKI